MLVFKNKFYDYDYNDLIELLLLSNGAKVDSKQDEEDIVRSHVIERRSVPESDGSHDDILSSLSLHGERIVLTIISKVENFGHYVLPMVDADGEISNQGLGDFDCEISETKDKMVNRFRCYCMDANTISLQRLLYYYFYFEL